MRKMISCFLSFMLVMAPVMCLAASDDSGYNDYQQWKRNSGGSTSHTTSTTTAPSTSTYSSSSSNDSSADSADYKNFKEYKEWKAKQTDEVAANASFTNYMAYRTWKSQQSYTKGNGPSFADYMEYKAWKDQQAEARQEQSRPVVQQQVVQAAAPVYQQPQDQGLDTVTWLLIYAGCFVIGWYIGSLIFSTSYYDNPGPRDTINAF